MMKAFVWVMVSIGLVASAESSDQQPELPFHWVVAPVGEQNPRNSEAAIFPLKDGSLLLGWTEFYAGSGADHGPARISGKLSLDGGRAWGEKFTLVDTKAFPRMAGQPGACRS